VTDFFEKNIAALKHRVANASAPPRPAPGKFATLTAASGDVTLRYNGILIHSTHDPVREGDALSRDVQPGDVVVLYGYGLGYHLPPLLEAVGDAGFVLAVELNPDLLGAAMALRDQTAVLNHPRFHLIFGEQEGAVAAEISRYMSGLGGAGGNGLRVKFHSPSLQCIPERFARITNALEILLMERRVPAVFGDLECVNFFFNKETVAGNPGIADLRGVHANQPALLAAAGPSLDDILPYLQTARSRGLVLASVDTSLPILARWGAAPDYVFSLDPQEESFSHFADHLDGPTKLIFTSTANCRVVHCYRGKKYSVFKEGHALNENFKEWVTAKGVTRAGGSVSCLGLDGLLQMGCDPIILAGQDCAFTGNRFYSTYSKHNELWLDTVETNRTLTVCHKENSKRHKVVSVQEDEDKRLLTNQMMYSYLRNVEQIAAAYPRRTIYSLCSHGAQIDGVLPLGSVNELAKILAFD
jgi:hypothetical protein